MTTKRKAKLISEFDSYPGDYRKFSPRWWATEITALEGSFILAGLRPPALDEGSAISESDRRLYMKYISRNGAEIFAYIIEALSSGEIRVLDRKSIFQWGATCLKLQDLLVPQMKEQIKAFMNNSLTKEHETSSLLIRQLVMGRTEDQIWNSQMKAKFCEIFRSVYSDNKLEETGLDRKLQDEFSRVLRELEQIEIETPTDRKSLLKIKIKAKVIRFMEEEYKACAENHKTLSFGEFRQLPRIQQVLELYKSNKLQTPTDKTLEEWIPRLRFPIGKK